MNSIYIAINNKDKKIIISHNGFGSEYLFKSDLINSFVNFCLTQSEKEVDSDLCEFDQYDCETCLSSFRSLCDLRKHCSIDNVLADDDEITPFLLESNIYHSIKNNSKNKSKSENTNIIMKPNNATEISDMNTYTRINSTISTGLKDNKNSGKTNLLEILPLCINSNDQSLSNENQNFNPNQNIASIDDKSCIIKYEYVIVETPVQNSLKLKCQYCEKQFATLSYLKYHLFSMHGYSEEKSTHLCPHCGKKYYYQSQLNNHLLSHHNLSQFKCQLCQKLFKTSQNLQRHIKSHKSDKDYACKHCDKRFKIQHSLMEHALQKHAPDRPFTCTQCSKSFATRDKLRKHREQHLKPKISRAPRQIYECRTCGRVCKDRHTLAAHQRVHSGDRPFSCKYCGKSFTYKHHVKKHLKNMFCTRTAPTSTWTLNSGLLMNLKENDGGDQYISSNQFVSFVDPPS